MRSSAGSARRSSASSLTSDVSCMPAPNMADIGSLPASTSGSPAPRMMLVASRTVSNSLRGMPIMSQMTRSGNGFESASTRSTSPRSHISSTTSAQIVSTESSTPWSCLGVNERATIPRCRTCRGSSMLMNDPKNSIASAGMSGIDTAPRPEQNSCGRRLISITSAYRVVTKNDSSRPTIGFTNVAGRNGAISRSSANRAMRSPSGRRQKAGSTSCGYTSDTSSSSE